MHEIENDNATTMHNENLALIKMRGEVGQPIAPALQPRHRRRCPPWQAVLCSEALVLQDADLPTRTLRLNRPATQATERTELFAEICARAHMDHRCIFDFSLQRNIFGQ